MCSENQMLASFCAEEIAHGVVLAHYRINHRGLGLEVPCGHMAPEGAADVKVQGAKFPYPSLRIGHTIFYTSMV